MNADEAVARVEEWLRLSELTRLAVDRENVRRVPDGWLVPYNSRAYLDGTNPDADLFPAPGLIVREPDGQLREAPPRPDMVSTPARVPGQRYLVELIDPEFAESGLAYLGVPPNAVVAWEDPETGEQILNHDYRSGGLRKGMRRPTLPLEWLLVFRNAGWLDDRKFLIALTQMDGYVRKHTNLHDVYASPLALGPTLDGVFYRRVSLSVHVQRVPADAEVLIRGRSGSTGSAPGIWSRCCATTPVCSSRSTSRGRATTRPRR
ncbi:YrhB domain-containing protein [Actinokineospora sp. G85]|uniref:YrhB domain-containing protein n=1 Tax=Actinokineospora sp. G85 TaxID=3406626 RepID=UPI003C735FC7